MKKLLVLLLVGLSLMACHKNTQVNKLDYCILTGTITLASNYDVDLDTRIDPNIPFMAMESEKPLRIETLEDNAIELDSKKKITDKEWSEALATAYIGYKQMYNRPQMHIHGEPSGYKLEVKVIETGYKINWKMFISFIVLLIVLVIIYAKQRR